MAFRKVGNTYKLFEGYAARNVLQPLGFEWDAKRGCWKLPANFNAEHVTALQTAFPQLEIPESLMKYFEQESLCRALQKKDDSTVRYGDDLDAYQRVGVKFLATAGRAILGDDVGLGKTVQALRSAQEVGAKRVLVVTRKSLIHQWLYQKNLWTTWDYQYDVFDITNYEQVVLRLQEFLDKDYDVLIGDECHLLKNRGTRYKPVKRTQAFYKLANHIPNVWLLTATPVLNRPDELWSLLHIVNKRKYASYWNFIEQYCVLETHPWTGNHTVISGIRPDKKADLSAELATICIRRVKDELDLPPLTRETIYVSLGTKQRAHYDQMLNEFYLLLQERQTEQGFLNDIILHAPSVLAQYTRLRQITCTPALVGLEDDSVKTEAVMDIIDSYALEHKILVFSEFSQYVDLLHKKMQPYGAVKITGKMSSKLRDEAIQRLNEDATCRILVGTTGAMGVGLNIQAASIVVFTDKGWVPAIMNQAEGRAHRRGQQKPVHTISIHATNTLDDYIDALLIEKQGIVDMMDIIARMAQARGGGLCG